MMNMRLENFLRCLIILIINLQRVRPSAVKNCKILNNLQTLKCHGNYNYYSEDESNITEIQLTNLIRDTLDLDEIVERFPNIEKISVDKSGITSIVMPTKRHPKKNKIKVLYIRHTKIKRFSRDFVKYFPHLKVLSLEGNLLKAMESDFYLGNLEELFIKDNPWRCSLDLTWALNLNKTIAKDLINITCKEKFIGKNLLLIAKYKEEMYQNCTELCNCSLENVVRDPRTDKHHPIIMVNCSGRGLQHLPTHLPSHTRILRLERNEISDLRPLKTNPVFKPLWELYLDNNSVNSISYLEGSHWLQNFRLFSLRGNLLQKVPAFALDNALMKNPNMPGAVVLYLGNNPWRCDCIFVPVFQELVLQKYSNRIVDINDVKCKYVEGDENSLLPIHSLSRSSVCMVPSDFSLQEGLDLLNAILASLIIFILGKLAYDYYNFKKYGKLPWIVSKMP